MGCPITNRVKVTVNALQDLFGLPFAKALYKPFKRHTGTFLIVASIVPVTKRQNVFRRCSGAFRR